MCTGERYVNRRNKTYLKWELILANHYFQRNKKTKTQKKGHKIENTKREKQNKMNWKRKDKRRNNNKWKIKTFKRYNQEPNLFILSLKAEFFVNGALFEEYSMSSPRLAKLLSLEIKRMVRTFGSRRGWDFQGAWLWEFEFTFKSRDQQVAHRESCHQMGYHKSIFSVRLNWVMANYQRAFLDTGGPLKLRFTISPPFNQGFKIRISMALGIKKNILEKGDETNECP